MPPAILGLGAEELREEAVLREAAARGVRYVHCTPASDEEERLKLVGRALRTSPEVTLATGTRARGAAAAEADLDRQLRLLGRETIDAWYLLYRNEPEELSDELLGVIERARRAGKIRLAGVTTHRPAALLERLRASPAVSILLAPLSFASGTEATAAAEETRRAGLLFGAIKPLAGGPWDGSCARALGAALRWVLRHPACDLVLVRTRSVAELRSNLEASEAPGLDDGALLAAHSGAIGARFCRMCGACAGQCARGLPVEGYLRALNYLDGYGDRAAARLWFGLASRGAAAGCGDCPACTVRCPFPLDIRARVERAAVLLHDGLHEADSTAARAGLLPAGRG
jgi:aryl-alcohol dehydrogenase-like predicted oxidoreductase